MTVAAEQLHMTQSGVSQNIKNLEDLLTVTLFDRNKKKILPTYHAELLFNSSEPHLISIEESLQKITGKKQVLQGVVQFAIPIEFGNNFILPLVAEFSKSEPAVVFKIKYGHASQVEQIIKNGELDFAFVDNFSFGEQIHSEIVYEEKLQLCCNQNYYLENQKLITNMKMKKENFEKLSYVDYVEDGTLLCQWFKHHYKFVPKVGLRVSLMDVQGVSRLITEGLGVGVLPEKVVEQLQTRGEKIYIFLGSGKVLSNKISFVSLEGRTLSPASIAIKNFILKKFRN